MQVMGNIIIPGCPDGCTVQDFKDILYNDEKSQATIDKYVRSIERLSKFLEGRDITKEMLIRYRDELLKTCMAQTVNGALSAINAYLDYCGMPGMKMRLLKVQRRPFLEESRELAKEDYKRLLNASRCRKDHRLYMILLTLGSTGIRISELRYITVEAAESGRAQIHLKGKNRTVILQKELCGRLKMYAEKRGIKKGYIFRIRSGRPMDRSNICHDMKKLSVEAKVEPCKVFPHNLRHLFARTFYEVEKNLAHLADVLGHSKIETTRIYIAASASTHEKILNKMQLII